jgi:hypothetical protein
MTEANSDAPAPDDTDPGPNRAKSRLRGDALDGAEQKASVGHTEYEETRNPDAELRLDGEADSLYSDGLDVGDDTESYAGTDGDAPKGFKG